MTGFTDVLTRVEGGVDSGRSSPSSHHAPALRLLAGRAMRRLTGLCTLSGRPKKGLQIHAPKTAINLLDGRTPSPAQTQPVTGALRVGMALNAFPQNPISANSRSGSLFRPMCHAPAPRFMSDGVRGKEGFCSPTSSRTFRDTDNGR